MADPVTRVEVGDQVECGTGEDYDLGTVQVVHDDGVYVTIHWYSGCSTVERWDRPDLQYVPCCARCSRQHYTWHGGEDGGLQVCTHCGLDRKV